MKEYRWTLACEHIRLSRWVAYILRYGIHRTSHPVDWAGWVPVNMLVEWAWYEKRSNAWGYPVTAFDIFLTVLNDDRGRFGLEWRPKEAMWYVRADPPLDDSLSRQDGHSWAPDETNTGGWSSSPP